MFNSDGRHRCVILYNLSFIEDESERPIANYEQVFQNELPGRLKILRGNLIGLSRRSQIYLFDYHNQVTIDFRVSQPVSHVSVGSPNVWSSCESIFYTQHPACLAMEVLSDCVIIVQLRSIDIFQLPDVARGWGPWPLRAARSFNAPLKFTKPCPPKSAWNSASIVPYCPPYPEERLSPASRPVSILASERLDKPHAVKHYYIFHPPRPILADSHSRSMNLSPTETLLHIAQVRTGVRPHYFHDVVVSPTSGRGLWVEQSETSPGMSRPLEHLMIFSAPHSSVVGGPLVDIGDSSTDMIGKGVRIAARNVPDAVRNCSYCSFDDESGRVVVTTHDGYVRVLQFGMV